MREHTYDYENLHDNAIAPSGDGKQPDPGKDEAVAVFWCLYDPNVQSENKDLTIQCHSGVIVTNNAKLSGQRLRDLKMDLADNELDLLNKVIDLVHELDPDIVIGWEVQSASWGYLDARSRALGACNA